MNRFFKKEMDMGKKTISRKKLVFSIILGIWLTMGTLAMYRDVHNFLNQYHFRNPIQAPWVKKTIPTPTKEASSSASLIPVAEASEKTYLYKGKVSTYSHAGCLGCGENQIMGNGQPFDENAMTLAVPCEDIISGKIKYGTHVKVTNLDINASVDGVITDCGGFSKYNRVADLSLGMAKILATKTDVSNVTIERL